MSKESPEPTRGVSLSTGVLLGIVVVVALVLAAAVYFGVPWGEEAAPEGIDPDENEAPAAYHIPAPSQPGYILLTSARDEPGEGA